MSSDRATPAPPPIPVRRDVLAALTTRGSGGHGGYGRYSGTVDTDFPAGGAGVDGIVLVRYAL